MAIRKPTTDAALLRAAAAWAKRYAPQQASQGQQEAPRVITGDVPVAPCDPAPRYIPLLLTLDMLQPSRVDARAVPFEDPDLDPDPDNASHCGDLDDLPAKYRLVPERRPAVFALLIIALLVIVACYAHGML